MYDLIIIGGGPAAMSAGIYAARFRLKTLILASMIGGAITGAHDIQNYPGFKTISGMDLMKQMEEQVRFQGVEIKLGDAVKITPKGNSFKINDQYECKAIVLAVGTTRRKLDIPGEKKYLGKGVSFCAICDAAFFRNKVVAIIGGSNSAAMAAQLLAEHSNKVYIIYRKEPMRAEPARVEDIENNPKIEFIYNTNILEIKGNKFLNKVILDREYKGSNELALDGVFIEIGSVPSTILTNMIGIELDDYNLIKTDAGQRTNIKGIYAAGDITTNSNKFMQIVTAVSEGAIAANSAYTDSKIDKSKKSNI